MYESHFGLSGPPFQLVPDPGFFFGSRGHSNALAFLQSAAHQGDGFLVVTGEIGAGKTTLVRTLLEGLDTKQVLAATLVSTQLESGDLPLAILLAFGAPQAGDSKAQLNASLEAFLIDLAGKGRRALLIVDEAQNLSRSIIEELRMLSNLQLGASALLQVFLVGQPDLRTQMQAKSMEQLRQRVTASCHLGPLDVNETRAYVEHRLRRVGWLERPPIDAQAFAEIHRWTAGIPRRINRLCNRLLLATYLERKDAITAESVEQIARDLRAEIGESDEQPAMEQSYVSHANAAATVVQHELPKSATDAPVTAARQTRPAEPATSSLAATALPQIGTPAQPEDASPELSDSPETAIASTVTPAVTPDIAPAESAALPLEDVVASTNASLGAAPSGWQDRTGDSPRADAAPQVRSAEMLPPAAEGPVPSAETAIPDALANFASLPAYSLAGVARSASSVAAPGPTLDEKSVGATALSGPGAAHESAPGGTAIDAAQPQALSVRPEEPVIEDDDADADADADQPLPRSAAQAKLPGVVAAHEATKSAAPVEPDRFAAMSPLGKVAPVPAPVVVAPVLRASLAPADKPVLQHRPGAASSNAGVDLPLDLLATPGTSPPVPVVSQNAAPVTASAPRAAADSQLGNVPPAATGKAVLEPLICLVDSPSDYVKARALGRVLSGYPDLPSVLIVHTGSVVNLDIGEEISGVMPQAANDVHLDISEHGGAASAALAITRFDAVLRVYRPRAILAMGASDTLLTCSLFAHKSAIPVLRNDAGRRRAWSRPGEEMNALLLERLAETCYIADLATYYTLYRTGITTERVLLVGNLADNVVHFASQHRVHPSEILRRVGAQADALAHPRGYALCTAQFTAPRATHEEVTGLIGMLTLVGRELPVLWAANEATVQELKALGKMAALKEAHIDLAPALRYLDCIDLLRGARCLLSGNAGHFLDDAVALGVPSIVIGPGMVVPVKATEALQLGSPLGADQLPSALSDVLAQGTEPREKAHFWDGATASRIATHLCEWLPQHGASKKRGKALPAPAAQSLTRPHHPDAAMELMGVSAP